MFCFAGHTGKASAYTGDLSTPAYGWDDSTVGFNSLYFASIFKCNFSTVIIRDLFSIFCSETLIFGSCILQSPQNRSLLAHRPTRAG